MAEPLVNLPAWAAAFLLFFATVSGSTGPWSRGNRGTTRIPSQFSEEERVAIKEALKGELSPPGAQMWVPQSPISPVLSPSAEGRLAARAGVPPATHRTGPASVPARVRDTMPGSSTPLASAFPCLDWKLQLL